MKIRAVAYSPAEMEWLEANRTMVISDYHRAFVAAFDRSDVTLAQLHGLRKRKGWKVGRREPGHYKGRRLKFSEDEIAWLRDNATMVISDYCRAFAARFGRDDMSEAALHSLRKREGFKTGRTGQFEKGAISHNKGKRCPEGTGGRHPNARKTQFMKGQSPHNARGPGHEWVDADHGYVIMIVDEPNPWKPGQQTRPVHKHRWLWEKANGPVPDGHVLKCLDGDKANCNPSNWEAIPREVLPRLNGRFGMNYEQSDPVIKPTIIAIARLKHAASKAREKQSPSEEAIS